MVNEHVSVKQVKDLMWGVEALQDKVGQIGEVIKGSANKKLTTSVWTNLIKLSLTKGIWLLNTHIAFQSNSGKTRACLFSPNENLSGDLFGYITIDPATEANINTYISYTVIHNMESDGDIYFAAIQKSGVELDAMAKVEAYRLS